jgi:hypothetical protein
VSTGSSAPRAGEKGPSAATVVGEVLAVRNEAGKITQVRLIKADGRYLRVELDGQGALLGVRHSGSFAEVSGQIYLKQSGVDRIRWIRVQRFRPVPRPPDWVEPELVCHEVEAEPDGIFEEDEEDAGADEESDW